jgi:hypothetical protein
MVLPVAYAMRAEKGNCVGDHHSKVTVSGAIHNRLHIISFYDDNDEFLLVIFVKRDAFHIKRDENGFCRAPYCQSH